MRLPDHRARALLIAALGVVCSPFSPASPLAPIAHAAPAPKTPPPPKAPAPPASVALTIDAPSPTGLWRMRVENTGDVPLRLTADARILSLEITPPNAKTAVHCSLPADMRPGDDVGRALVLPSKRSYSESFDPRLYCFGANEAALVAGAKVVAHLGFVAIGARPVAKPAAPFVLSPFEGVEPAVAPAKEIVGAPLTLASTETPTTTPVTPPPPSPKPEAGGNPFPVTLSLAVPRHVEAQGSVDLAVTVTVSNDGVRPVTLLFRPETIGFDLLGPGGATRCTWPAGVGGAVREAFTTLAPKAKQSVSVVLRAVCPGSAFDQGGLFVVRPRIDTRRVFGAEVGISAFRGEIIGAHTTLLRIHHGRRPPRPARPTLD